MQKQSNTDLLLPSSYETIVEFYNAHIDLKYENVKLAHTLSLKEIVSNAVKASEEAGQSTKPLIIEYTGDSIKIRDWGLGLTPERVYYLYNGIKCSNDKTLGIGRFSPLSCKMGFMIRTFPGDNHCYVYGVSRTKTGIPSIKLFDKYPSNEPTGTEVIVPSLSEIKEDYWNIQAAAGLLKTNPDIILNGKKLNKPPMQNSLIGSYPINYQDSTLVCDVYSCQFMKDSGIWLDTGGYIDRILNLNWSNSQAFMASDLYKDREKAEQEFSLYGKNHKALTLVLRASPEVIRYNKGQKVDESKLQEPLVRLVQEQVTDFLSPFISKVYNESINRNRIHTIQGLIESVETLKSIPFLSNTRKYQLKLNDGNGLHYEKIRGFTVNLELNQKEPSKLIELNPDNKELTLNLTYIDHSFTLGIEGTAWIGSKSDRVSHDHSRYDCKHKLTKSNGVVFHNYVLSFHYVLIKGENSPAVTANLITKLTGCPHDTLNVLVIKEFYKADSDYIKKVLDGVSPYVKTIYLETVDKQKELSPEELKQKEDSAAINRLLRQIKQTNKPFVGQYRGQFFDVSDLVITKEDLTKPLIYCSRETGVSEPYQIKLSKIEAPLLENYSPPLLLLADNAIERIEDLREKGLCAWVSANEVLKDLRTHLSCKYGAHYKLICNCQFKFLEWLSALGWDYFIPKPINKLLNPSTDLEKAEIKAIKTLELCDDNKYFNERSLLSSVESIMYQYEVGEVDWSVFSDYEYIPNHLLYHLFGREIVNYYDILMVIYKKDSDTAAIAILEYLKKQETC